MRPSVLRKREKARRKRLIEDTIPVNIYVPVSLEELPNELLYKLATSSVCSDREYCRVLEILTERMKPVMLKIAPGYFRVLCWNANDAIAEGMELIWWIIKEKKYTKRGAFKSFFAVCYKNRLGQIYRKGVRYNPDFSHNVIIDYCAKLPVYNEAGYFNIKYIEKENKSRRKK